MLTFAEETLKRCAFTLVDSGGNRNFDVEVENVDVEVENRIVEVENFDVEVHKLDVQD